jgi:hypothetical protein
MLYNKGFFICSLALAELLFENPRKVKMSLFDLAFAIKRIAK